MDKELLGGIIALLTAVAGIIRLLMGYWFKKMKENEELKAKLTEKTIQSLEMVVDNHKTLLKIHADQLKAVQTQLKDMVAKEARTREAFGRIAERMKDFVDSTEKRLSKLDSMVIQVTEEVRIFKGPKGVKHAKSD